MPADLVNRVGRVINSPNKLKLHARADLESKVLTFLPNGTTFRVKGVQRAFYHVVLLSGEGRGKYGYVYKDKSLDGEYYVELLPVAPDGPVDPPIRDPRLSTGGNPWWRSIPIGWWIVSAAVLAVLVWVFSR